MFRGLWRALRGEPGELLALEVVITMAIIAIPLFFAPVIPIAPGLPNQEGSEQAAEENQPVVESIFAWSIFRAERFIHGYKDDLIAVFTIVLAWSTIGLWGQTRRLAEDAEEQSKKMVASIRAMEKQARNTRLVQRPYLNIRRLSLSPIPGTDGPLRVYGVPGNPSTLGTLCGIDCELENRGRSICQIVGARFAANYDRAIGPMPAMDQSTLLGDHLIGEGSVYFPGRPVCTIVLPDSFPVHGIGARILFVCGWIRYSDLFGVIRRRGFAYEFIPPFEGSMFFDPDVFVACEPESYWYEVEETTDA